MPVRLFGTNRAFSALQQVRPLYKVKGTRIRAGKQRPHPPQQHRAVRVAVAL